MRHDGGLMIALGAGLALAVAVYNWFAPAAFLAPQTSIAGTPGALLMIAATAILTLAGLVLGGTTTNRALIGFLMAGSLVGILGTGLAARLLESQVTLGLMGLCLVGWLIRALGPRRLHA